MIKKAVLIFIVLAVWVLTGCGGKNPDGSQSGGSPVATKAEVNPPETAAPTVSETPVQSQTAAKTAGPPASVSISPEEQAVIDSFVGIKAPDFTLVKTDGTEVTLKELLGKPLVLNFWATWCPYCVAEFPYFTQAQKDFPEVQFYGVNTSEKTDLGDMANRESLEQFARENGFEITLLFDIGSKVYNGPYATQGLPTTFFIDGKGNVRAYIPGAFPDYKMLKEYLAALVKADKTGK